MQLQIFTLMKKIDLLRSKALLKAFKKLYLLGLISDAQVDHLYINLLIQKHPSFNRYTARRDRFCEELVKDRNIHICEDWIKKIDMDWRRDIPAAELARRQARLDLLP